MSDTTDQTEKDAERTAVRTYVPAYQKEEWQDHAEDLGMSLSEFVRTMVQAGRSDFQIPDASSGGDGGDTQSASAGESSRRELDLERHLLSALSEDEFTSWAAIVDEVSGDLEDHLYEIVERLRDEGRVKHDPREGGYRLVER